MAERIDRLVDKPILKTDDIRRIMGQNNYFGPETILEYLGGQPAFNSKILENVQAPTWLNRNVLEGQCPFYPNEKFSETHFVYFTPSICIKDLVGLFSKENHPRIVSYWLSQEYAKQDYHLKKSVPGWHAQLIKPVPINKEVCLNDLMATIDKSYELTKAVDLVTSNIFYYLLNKKYICENIMFHCQDRDTSEFSSGSSVVVGSITEDDTGDYLGNGVFIGHSVTDLINENIQVSVSRKT